MSNTFQSFEAKPEYIKTIAIKNHKKHFGGKYGNKKLARFC